MTTQTPIAVPAAARYAGQAEKYLECGAGTSIDARAITTALLYVGAAIEAAAERGRDDLDALGALLDDRLGDLSEVIDPSSMLPVRPERPPLWARLVGVFRRSPGWHDEPVGQ